MGSTTLVDYDSWKVVMGYMTFVNYDSWKIGMGAKTVVDYKQLVSRDGIQHVFGL